MEDSKPAEETVSKKVAAIEVLATFEKLKIIAYAGIGATWIGIIGTFIHPSAPIAVALVATLLIGFFFIREKQRAEHLQQKYGLFVAQHYTANKEEAGKVSGV